MIYGLVVAKNEADRYLEASLDWLRTIVDELIVFDDQSIDTTRQIAEASGAIVGVRTSGPSFLENESGFRQAAWWFLETALEPTTDDWVLSLDADEALIDSTGRAPREALDEAITQATAESCDVIEFPVAEVFDVIDGQPLIRTDGQWAHIRAARLCRWQESPTFRDVKLAGGSLPKSPSPVLRAGNPTIVHYGYAAATDRLSKYDRYRARPGHSMRHIESIITAPTLLPWTGMTPPIVGVKR